METLIKIIKNFFLNFINKDNKETKLIVKTRNDLMGCMQELKELQLKELENLKTELVNLEKYLRRTQGKQTNPSHIAIFEGCKTRHEFVKNKISLIENHSLPAITKYLEEFPKQNEIIYYKGVNSEKYNITNVLESEIDVKIKQKLVVLRWQNELNLRTDTLASQLIEGKILDSDNLKNFIDNYIKTELKNEVDDYNKIKNPSSVIVYNNKEYFTKEIQDTINVVLPNRVESHSKITFLQARMLREAELKEIVNNESVLIKEVNKEVEKKVLVQGRDESNVEFVKRQKLAEETLEFSKKTWGGLYYDWQKEKLTSHKNIYEMEIDKVIKENLLCLNNTPKLYYNKYINGYNLGNNFKHNGIIIGHPFPITVQSFSTYYEEKFKESNLVEEKFKNFKEFAPKEVSKITNTEEKKINCCMEEQIELLSIISLVIIIGVLLISILGGLIYWKKNKNKK